MRSHVAEMFILTKFQAGRYIKNVFPLLTIILAQIVKEHL